MLDDAGRMLGKTSSADPVKPVKPLSSDSIAFPESFAAVAPYGAATPSPRKN
jgi:penicillin-binding protein 1A